MVRRLPRSGAEDGSAGKRIKGEALGLIVRELRDEILDGRLRPGERIHQEAVAERFGTSRCRSRGAAATPARGARRGPAERRARASCGSTRRSSARSISLRERLEPLAIERSAPALDADQLGRDAARGRPGWSRTIPRDGRQSGSPTTAPSTWRASRAPTLPRLLTIIQSLWNVAEQYRRAYLDGPIRLSGTDACSSTGCCSMRSSGTTARMPRAARDAHPADAARARRHPGDLRHVRFAVDTGGTFTDLVVEDDDGALHLFKSPTTPDDPVERRARRARRRRGRARRRSARPRLGLRPRHDARDQRGAHRVARRAPRSCTTEGHPDVLLFREGGRTDAFNFTRPYPEPYVPRALTFEVPERIDSQGNVVKALDEAAVVALGGAAPRARRRGRRRVPALVDRQPGARAAGRRAARRAPARHPRTRSRTGSTRRSASTGARRPPASTRR